MPKSVHITAPWPTQKEMVGHLRISKARKKELLVILEEAKAKLSSPEAAPLNLNRPEKRRKSASAA
jgi:hypothetical protein